jgi:hypothetical protein
MNIQQTLYAKHQHCDCYVERHYQQKKGRTRSINRARVTAGNPSPRPALMCKRHDCWLKWLTETEAQAIEGISNGI